MENPDKQTQADVEPTNAQMNREQLFLFLRKTLSRSQRLEYELTQAIKLLTCCTANMMHEREEMSRRMIELYGELDDQDRELDELYGLKPDRRDL